jgi:hypothetical protein
LTKAALDVGIGWTAMGRRLEWPASSEAAFWFNKVFAPVIVIRDRMGATFDAPPRGARNAWAIVRPRIFSTTVSRGRAAS